MARNKSRSKKPIIGNYEAVKQAHGPTMYRVLDEILRALTEGEARTNQVEKTVFNSSIRKTLVAQDLYPITTNPGMDQSGSNVANSIVNLGINYLFPHYFTPSTQVTISGTNSPVFEVFGEVMFSGLTHVENYLGIGATATSGQHLLIDIGPQAVTPLSPTQIANSGNLIMWFETDVLEEAGSAHGDLIELWSGISPAQATNFNETTSANRPRFETNQTPTGKPGVMVTDNTTWMDADGADWEFGSKAGTDRNYGMIIVSRVCAQDRGTDRIFGNCGGGAKQAFKTPASDNDGIPQEAHVMDDAVNYAAGSGIPQPAKASWNIHFFWYDATDHSHRYWSNGTEYSSGLIQDVDVDIDCLFANSAGTGHDAPATSGTGMAAALGFGYAGVGDEANLLECQRVHNFIAKEYLGDGYQIQGAVDPIRISHAGTIKSVFNADGWCHIGGSDPQTELDVEGNANISSGLVVGTSVVAGTSVTAPVVTGSTSVSGVTVYGTTISGQNIDASVSVSGKTATFDTVTAQSVTGSVSVSAPTVTGSTSVSGVNVYGVTVEGKTLEYDGQNTDARYQASGLYQSSGLYAPGAAEYFVRNTLVPLTDAWTTSGINGVGYTDNTGLSQRRFHLDYKSLSADTPSDDDEIAFRETGLNFHAKVTFGTLDGRWATSGLELGDLGNVSSVSTPISGHVLSFNGTGWVNATAAAGGGSSLLSGLDDTLIGVAASGHALVYNGLKWVNGVIAGAGGVSEAQGDGFWLRLDGTNSPMTGGFTMNDNAELNFGTGNDIGVKYDGTNLYFDMAAASAGNIEFHATPNFYSYFQESNASLHIRSSAPAIFLEETGFTDDATWRIRSDVGLFTISDSTSGLSNVAVFQIGSKLGGQASSAGAYKFFANDFWLDNDNASLILGEGGDASLLYDGTDLVINPKVAGTGKVEVQGTLNATALTVGGVPVGGSGDLREVAVPLWHHILTGDVGPDINSPHISGTYHRMELHATIRSDRASQQIEGVSIALNNDQTQANYQRLRIRNRTGTLTGASDASNSCMQCPGDAATAGHASQAHLVFNLPQATTFHKTFHVTNWNRTSNEDQELYNMSWESTTAISGLRFTTGNASNFVAGTTFTLIGYKFE